MKQLTWCMALWLTLFYGTSVAQSQSESTDDDVSAALTALAWVNGPTTVAVGNNSTLVIPANYVFLDAANTSKFNELNQNLGGSNEVMVAPDTLQWSAYLNFSDEGYVKDDEQIDAPALLKTLQDSAESNNAERKRRGWSPLHVIDWALPPAYNRNTKRLEWATTIESEGRQITNFETKILGRRGYTTVILAADPGDLQAAAMNLNQVLGEYKFNSGESYAEWKPGDRVAKYGLTALIVGGAAAVATKKGFWAILGGLFAGAWKLIAAAVVGALAWLGSLFKRKTS